MKPPARPSGGAPIGGRSGFPVNLATWLAIAAVSFGVAWVFIPTQTKKRNSPAFSKAAQKGDPAQGRTRGAEDNAAAFKEALRALANASRSAPANKVVPAPTELTPLQELVANGSPEISYAAKWARSRIQFLLDERIRQCLKQPPDPNIPTRTQISVDVDVHVRQRHLVVARVTTPVWLSGGVSPRDLDCVQRAMEATTGEVRLSDDVQDLPQGYLTKETFALPVSRPPLSKPREPKK